MHVTLSKIIILKFRRIFLEEKILENSSRQSQSIQLAAAGPAGLVVYVINIKYIGKFSRGSTQPIKSEYHNSFSS